MEHRTIQTGVMDLGWACTKQQLDGNIGGDLGTLACLMVCRVVWMGNVGVTESLDFSDPVTGIGLSLSPFFEGVWSICSSE